MGQVVLLDPKGLSVVVKDLPGKKSGQYGLRHDASHCLEVAGLRARGQQWVTAEHRAKHSGTRLLLGGTGGNQPLLCLV